MPFNGKKRYVVIPLALILTVGGAVYKYGKLNERVAIVCEDTKENTKKLEEVPAQIARIEENVENIEGDVKEMRVEQREMRNDIKLILRAVR